MRPPLHIRLNHQLGAACFCGGGIMAGVPLPEQNRLASLPTDAFRSILHLLSLFDRLELRCVDKALQKLVGLEQATLHLDILAAEQPSLELWSRHFWSTLAAFPNAHTLYISCRAPQASSEPTDLQRKFQLLGQASQFCTFHIKVPRLAYKEKEYDLFLWLPTTLTTLVVSPCLTSIFKGVGFQPEGSTPALKTIVLNPASFSTALQDFQYCQHLKEAHLSFDIPVVIDVTPALPCWPALDVLKLSMTNALSTTLQAVLGPQKMRAINQGSFYTDKFTDLIRAASQLPDLADLEFCHDSCFSLVTDFDPVFCFHEGFTALQRLHLEVNGFSSELLKCLGSLPLLTELNMTYKAAGNTQPLPSKILELSCPDDWQLIGHVQNVELSFGHARRLSLEGLHYVKGLKKLTIKSLGGSPEESSANFLKHLPACISLKHLDMDFRWEGELPSCSLLELQSLTQLESFRYVDPVSSFDQSPMVFDQLARSWQGLTRLVYVDEGYRTDVALMWPLTLSGISALGSFSRLAELHLDVPLAGGQAEGCQSASFNLSSLEHLQVLNLKLSNYLPTAQEQQADLLVQLANCIPEKSLTELSLEVRPPVKVPCSFLDHLLARPFPCLQRFKLKSYEQTGLIAGTADHIGQLPQRMPNLQSLTLQITLKESEATRTAVQQLGRLSQLVHLELSGFHQASRDDVITLARSCPGLRSLNLGLPMLEHIGMEVSKSHSAVEEGTAWIVMDGAALLNCDETYILHGKVGLEELRRSLPGVTIHSCQ